MNRRQQRLEEARAAYKRLGRRIAQLEGRPSLISEQQQDVKYNQAVLAHLVTNGLRHIRHYNHPYLRDPDLPVTPDEAAIIRAVEGAGYVPLSTEEQVEAIRRLAARAWPDRKIADRLGLDRRTVLRHRHQNGIAPGGEKPVCGVA